MENFEQHVISEYAASTILQPKQKKKKSTKGASPRARRARRKTKPEEVLVNALRADEGLAEELASLIWNGGEETILETKLKKEKASERVDFAPVDLDFGFGPQPDDQEEEEQPVVEEKVEPTFVKDLRTRRIRDAMEASVHDTSGNSEAGAALLRKLLMPELVVDEVVDATTTSFADGIDAELVRATAVDPDERTAADLAVIQQSLGCWHPFFDIARGRLRAKLLRHVQLVSQTKAFRVIFLQGEIADSVYIVYSGRLHMRSLPEPPPDRDRLLRGPMAQDQAQFDACVDATLGACLAVLDRGDAFGETAFVPDGYGRRETTVVTAEPNCYLFRISRRALLPERVEKGRLSSFKQAPHDGFLAVLRKPAAKRTEDDLEIVLHFCSWQPFFLALEKSAAKVACRHLRLVEARSHEVVVLQGAEADAYFIVYVGSADVYVQKDSGALAEWEQAQEDHGTATLPLAVAGACVFKLQQGFAFGESGLDDGKHRNATVVANSKRTMLLALYRDDIRAALGQPSASSSESKTTRKLTIILDDTKATPKRRRRSSTKINKT